MLSPHFSYAEMTRTNVRQSNEPGIGELENLKVLCAKIMEPCRDLVGPIWITSGFRNYIINTRIGGSPSSQHCKGQAADWVPLSMDLKGAFLKVMESVFVDYDQLIFEVPNGLGRGWIHISHDPNKDNQRGQVLLCIRPGRFEPWDRKVFDELK